MSENEVKVKENWWSKNKEKVVMVCGGICVCIGVGVLTYLGIKNKDAILGLFKTTENLTPQALETVRASSEVVETVLPVEVIVHKPINGGDAFGVTEHLRNMGQNRYPSQEKIAEALSKGIVLGGHQTLVDAYLKNTA